MKRISFINGTNKAQDYDVQQTQSLILTAGVSDTTHLEVVEQTVPDNTVKVKAGVCLIPVTRVSDGKDFKVYGELTEDINVTVLETATHPTWVGAIIACIPKAKIENGLTNPEDGSGVFDIIAVAGLSTGALSDGQINSQTSSLYYWIRLADVVQDPTVETANITDERILIGIKAISIDNLLIKDEMVVATELATKPFTPDSGRRGFMAKADGWYDVDDTGAETKFSTGETIPVGAINMWSTSTAPSSWLLCEGGTIGDASSGGTARANADCETLFKLLWNNFADAQLAVTGGRGASANNDWTAHKKIALPNMGGRVPVGLNGGTFNANGKTGGEETHVLTEAELAAHTHSVQPTVANGAGGQTFSYQSGSTTTQVGTSGSTGSSTAHNNLQPYFTTRFIIRYI